MSADVPPAADVPPVTHRPRDLGEHELGFAPRPAVRWLSPGELRSAATKLVVSSLFGAYADKRELQGTFPDPLVEHRTDADELWVDFVADLGDGFDATYTVAWLLGQEKLEVATPDGTTTSMPRGSLLVMGGDEVYPTASTREYEDRTKGPYRAAFPVPPDDGEAPLLVALPGNHDWYDGLTAFLRVFCQRRPIGGWRTEQPRSYFAVRLPRRWWLLGVDIQLGGYVDDPQLRFFTERVRPLLRPGDGVVVATGKPSWVDTGRGDVDAFNTLDYLDRHVVAGTGAQVRLWVSGDKHHYVRYAETGADGTPVEGGRQLVTCGIGGAYLSATHDLPASLQVPPSRSRVRERSAPVRYDRATAYPDEETSRRIGRRVWGIPWRNPGLAPLAMGLQLLLVAVLAGGLSLLRGATPLEALRGGGASDVGRLAVGLAFVAALAAAADGLRTLVKRARPVVGSPVGALVGAQLVVALAALLVMAVLPLPTGLAGFVVGFAYLAVAAVVAGAVGVELFAGWMLLVGLYGRDAKVLDWVFSGQAVEHHKGFLRMRIDRDGNLTVHPVVVDRVCRTWRATPDDEPAAPWIAPDGRAPAPRLAEAPVTVTRSRRETS